MQNELVRRETLTALVGTYQLAEQEIRQAYGLLEAAEKRLKSVFLYDYFRVNTGNSYRGTGKEYADSIMKEVNRSAWTVIFDRLEIRRILSIQRREELDKQLSGDKSWGGKEIPPLPEITEANILAMFQDGMAKSVDYAREAVYEVFDWLRPHAGRAADLKTNDKWRIGKKVITAYTVELKYTTGFQVKYHREKELTALDNVFHMLDGRGPLKTYHGPLYDAINKSSDGTGETDFFKFRCCKNGNLHLDFKRPDLVQKINAMAGGNRLKQEA